jgi:signal transduction histidine kinase
MQTNTLIIFLCLAAFGASAQNNATDLRRDYARLDSLCEAAKGADDLKSVMALSKQMASVSMLLNDDTLTMKAQLLQGQSMDFSGIYDSALKTYFELLNRAERSNSCYYRVKTLTLIAALYQQIFDWPSSLQYGNQAKQKAIACGMMADTLLINYGLGRALFNLGQTKAGFQMIEQNLQVSKQYQVLEGVFYGINDLSNLYAEAGNFKKALEIGLEALDMPEGMLGDLEKAQIYQRLSQIATELKDWDKAQEYVDKAFKYAQSIQLNPWLYECYQTQSIIHKANGKYKEALENFQQYTSLKDTILQEKYTDKMAAMTTLYELESKQKTISLLEKEQQIKEGKIVEQRVYMLAGLLLLGLLILFIRFRNQRNINQLRETFAQDLIKTQEQERQRISKDLHDSVGQNILFIKNRLQLIAPETDPTLNSSINNALEEVRNIAKDLYPNQLEQYGLSSAVEALCSMVSESSGIFASSDLEGLDAVLNKDAKINCYRIIQECMNNTIKHASATAIRISSNHQGNQVELVVQDNGKGFDTSLLERKAHYSFGMINIQERIRMLRGKFDLESSLNKGAKITFSIPV